MMEKLKSHLIFILPLLNRLKQSFTVYKKNKLFIFFDHSSYLFCINRFFLGGEYLCFNCFCLSNLNCSWISEILVFSLFNTNFFICFVQFGWSKKSCFMPLKHEKSSMRFFCTEISVAWGKVNRPENLLEELKSKPWFIFPLISFWKKTQSRLKNAVFLWKKY